MALSAEARKWLPEEGAVAINAAVTKFSGKHIGAVPIENLEIEIPEGISKKEIADAISNPAHKCEFFSKGGYETIFIFI